MSTYFSVIVPTYNRAHLLDKTIRCILNQTFADFELIIVDDASTDDTQGLISSFVDPRIVSLKNEVNRERSASRNRGITHSKGKFICFCDSDDHWRANHLELLHDKIKTENEREALYFTAMTWNFPDRKQDVIFPSPVGENLVEYVIKYQIGTPTTAFGRSILEKQTFRTDLKINEDVELFSRVVALFPLTQIPVPTVDVIIHPENTRGLHKNYISPQIHAMKIIFGNPLCKGKISKEFKKERMRSLRHQLINHYAETGQIIRLQLEVIRFLWMYPKDFQNKSKLVMLVYSLGGKHWLVRIVS
jgi:glycosyltransferase involved in cell wall biosynthesis